MRNGFVSKYWNDFKQILREYGVDQKILDNVSGYEDASDIVSYLFSVGSEFSDNVKLNLLKQLEEDKEMRYVFIFFFGAIFYYVAMSMKMSNLSMPATIAFSGNGSRTLSILSVSQKTVAQFAQLIFNKVYGENNNTIEVLIHNNPKIVTCKGGLAQPNAQPYQNIKNIMKVYAGDTFEKENSLTYGAINDTIQENVVNSVVDFFNFIFTLHDENNEFLINELSAERSCYNTVKKYCLGDKCRQTLKDSLSRGLQGRDQDENYRDASLVETLFFYPLVRFIHDFGYKIAKNDFE